MSNTEEYKSFHTKALWVLLFLLICRLLSMYVIPLNDSTEARYGEIARKMLETGNWVTLLHDYGIPFWAKPPLSTWLSALSMKAFGVNEFAARLPALLLSIGVLGLVWHLAKKQSGRMVATTSVLVLASCLYFFLDAGTVMTDPSLLFCTTLAMVSFWMAMAHQEKIWSYLFFVGLGLGLLAKGPIAIVLVGMPIFVWVLLRQQWRALWQCFPWFSGALLLLIIALPWYILAEKRTPGFLNYFIVGEHFSRFLHAGWVGDKYGFAHSAPLGIVWLYLLLGILPWSVPVFAWLYYHAKQVPSLCKDKDGWASYLLLSILMPLAFFTFSKNIIYPYTFPTLPAFALLFAELSSRAAVPNKIRNRYIYVAAITGFIFLIGVFLFLVKPGLIGKSHKSVMLAWKNQHPAPQSNLIYWASAAPYSAQFYSGGAATAVNQTEKLCRLLSNHQINYVVINDQGGVSPPQEILVHLKLIETFKIRKEHYKLYRLERFNC